MLQYKPAPIPEADRRDNRSSTQLGLVVAVVAHRVGAVAIEICQAGVEIHPQLLAKSLPQVCQRLRPRHRLVRDAGVAVDTVPHPGREARRGHGAAVKGQGVLFPGNLVRKHSKQPIIALDPARIVVDAAWDLSAHGAKVLAALSRSLTW